MMHKARAMMLFVIFACGAVAVGRAAAEQLDRQRLIGAWRLVAIEYTGPHGEARDPFYQPNSSGLIVYDASGWMSVQISAPARAHLAMPALRTDLRQAASSARKARAFDSYYAYFGTWDFDPTASTVTHHLHGSLLSDEVGVNYTQNVTFEAGRLVFTNTIGTPDAHSVRKKIWERVAATPDRP